MIGYTSGTDTATFPLMKKYWEIPNDSSTSRSRCSSRNGRLGSTNGARNSSTSGSHTYQRFRALPGCGE